MDFNEFLSQSCHSIGNKNFVTLLELNEPDQSTTFNSITGSQFLKSVEETASRLDLSQLQNHKVAILSENSLELLILFCACLLRGAQVCLLDYKLTLHEIDQILADFKPHFLFLDTKKWKSVDYFDLVKTKLINIQDLKNIPLNMTNSTRAIGKQDSQKILVYTSGTSGSPKGVVLDISVIFFEVQSLKNSFKRDYSNRKTMSILPLNHIYGLIGFFMSLWCDQEILLTQSLAPTHIRQLIQEKKPDYLYVVPQFLWLIRNRVIDGIKAKPFLIRMIAFSMLWLNKYLRSERIANKFFGEIRKQIGSSIEFSISGGAPLSKSVFDFFEAIKIPVCNGYGLSETGPVISTNNLQFRRRGSVGKVIDGVTVKLDSVSGEILVKGPNIFLEYYGKNELTQQSFTTDRWFKTGDLGYLDKDGYLFVDGRSKNMIVLPSGKKIQPEEIEGHFSQLPFLKNCCFIYGGAKNKIKKLYLVVELNEGLLLADKASYIQSLVQSSQSLAAFKRPQEFLFRSTPLPMTTTLKVKRFLVQREIDSEC
ncbi:MAG: AMP-binding protein [Deltaproteobacteria bacterium]|nr:AMP-binding protein [Deltaproteobacteria bacterium]